LLESLSEEVLDYVSNITGTVDYSIPYWIANISNQTKLKEYINAEEESFAKSKNFKKMEQYLSVGKEIDSLNKKIENLEIKKENLEFEAASEILYKFQEELIEKDFESFYELFMKEVVDDCEGEDEDFILSDIHPDIVKKYLKDVKMHLDAKKYNI